MKGVAFKFGNDINTDLIISGRYKFSITDPLKLSKYIFEDIDSAFYKKVRGKKFFIVAGTNFGCGSSREQAPLVIKYSGCKAVIAKSFARIFYRNSFNLGIPLIVCNTDKILNRDLIEVDLEKGVVIGREANVIPFKPFNKFQKALISEGGIINLYKKQGGLKIAT